MAPSFSRISSGAVLLALAYNARPVNGEFWEDVDNCKLVLDDLPADLTNEFCHDWSYGYEPKDEYVTVTGYPVTVTEPAYGNTCDDYGYPTTSGYPEYTKYPDYSTSDKYPEYSTSDKYPEYSTSDKYPEYSTSAKYPDYSTSAKYPEYSTTGYPDYSSKIYPTSVPSNDTTTFSDESTSVPTDSTSFSDDSTSVPTETTSFSDESTATSAEITDVGKIANLPSTQLTFQGPTETPAGETDSGADVTVTSTVYTTFWTTSTIYDGYPAVTPPPYRRQARQVEGRAAWCVDRPCRLVPYDDYTIVEACKRYLNWKPYTSTVYEPGYTVTVPSYPTECKKKDDGYKADPYPTKYPDYSSNTSLSPTQQSTLSTRPNT
ncbi:hypothetical protein OPT61_g4616 [Boeremia exigua]|uniref:Uncharacterized protein n=1 Tax=Boeremia exigua TaxID=749465 RepID=A0ACC2IDD3_9PLEO|nr:hypothetical protein OPT61_g4616 [Boeremia exigua]